MATALAAGQSSVIAAFQGLTASSVLTVSEPGSVLVTSVSPSFNKRHMVSQIRITFSGAVKKAQAQTAGNYRLTTIGSNGVSKARNAGVIPLSKAIYDSVHHVVILILRKPLALTKSLQLVINGSAPRGLRDSSGRLLDGDKNGIAGGNSVTMID